MNNDRLKFRAWDGCDMIYFDLSLCNSESQEWFDNTIWRNPVMQFTGLYDCSGNEVWEGDIIKHANGRIGVVEYDVGSISFQTNNNSYVLDQEQGIYPERMEVIGNIHQHKHLLDGGNDSE